MLGAEFGGVVYLDEGDHKAILLRGGGTMGLERCGLPKERRFSFFDQVHTTGMDIPQAAIVSRAAVSIATVSTAMVSVAMAW